MFILLLLNDKQKCVAFHSEQSKNASLFLPYVQKKGSVLHTKMFFFSFYTREFETF